MTHFKRAQTNSGDFYIQHKQLGTEMLLEWGSGSQFRVSI